MKAEYGNDEANRRLYKALEDCQPYLKDGETPAECIVRNRVGLDMALKLLAKEKKKNELVATYVSGMEQALRPFADHPDFYAPDEWAVTIIDQESRTAGVTAGDFRAAKNAMLARIPNEFLTNS